MFEGVLNGVSDNAPGAPPTNDVPWQWHSNKDELAGGGSRYVDPTYQRDATGRILTPQEQQYWREYDKQRADQNGIYRANYAASHPGTTADAGGSNAVYDPTTHTWSVYGVGGSKTWTSGINTADLQSKLSQQLKDQYPDWYWGQSATEQDQNKEYNDMRMTDRRVEDAQRFSPETQTRYQPQAVM